MNCFYKYFTLRNGALEKLLVKICKHKLEYFTHYKENKFKKLSMKLNSSIMSLGGIFYMNYSNNNNNMNSHIIYLCIKENNSPIYLCKKIDSIKYDTYYYHLEYKKSEYSAIISICKYIPDYFHYYILTYKLSKLFIKTKIMDD
jgi:hypothetical protein